MPMAWCTRACGIAVDGDEAGGQRGRPVAVAVAGEADPHVGREDARVQAADQQPHAGPDGVGQGAGAGCAGGDRGPTRRVAGASMPSIVNPAPISTSRRRSVGHAEKLRPGSGPRGRAGLDVALEQTELQRSADPQNAMEVGQREGHRGGGEVDVGVAGPRSSSRGVCEGQPGEIGLHPGGERRRVPVRSSIERGRRERRPGAPATSAYQPGPHPRSSTGSPAASGSTLAAAATRWASCSACSRRVGVRVGLPLGGAPLVDRDRRSIAVGRPGAAVGWVGCAVSWHRSRHRRLRLLHHRRTRHRHRCRWTAG